MNSTKLKRRQTQKTKALPLRNDSKLKKYSSRKTFVNPKGNAPAKIINEVIQIKRKRIKMVEGCKKPAAFGDSDSIKSSNSQESVIYMGTKYPNLNNLQSVVDLTKSDSDVVLRNKRKVKRNMKAITTIQSVNKLACSSSEDIGLIIKNLNHCKEAVKATESSIQLKRAVPCTSMPGCDGTEIAADAPFLDDVSSLISGDLGQINTIERMVYEMDIDTIVELYKVDTLDQFEGLEI